MGVQNTINHYHVYDNIPCISWTLIMLLLWTSANQSHCLILFPHILCLSVLLISPELNFLNYHLCLMNSAYSHAFQICICLICISIAQVALVQLIAAWSSFLDCFHQLQLVTVDVQAQHTKQLCSRLLIPPPTSTRQAVPCSTEFMTFSAQLCVLCLLPEAQLPHLSKLHQTSFYFQ